MSFLSLAEQAARGDQAKYVEFKASKKEVKRKLELSLQRRNQAWREGIENVRKKGIHSIDDYHEAYRTHWTIAQKTDKGIFYE